MGDTLKVSGGYIRDVTSEAAASGAIGRNGLDPAQPVRWNTAGDYFYQYDSPTSLNPPKEFNDAELRSRLKLDDDTANRPPPTTANPHPPELIPDTSDAIAVCTSPDVCRSPSQAVPYMVHGEGSDDRNYSPNVRSNGLVIKRRDSRFTRTYGDKPGVGLGVKSNTVGDEVTPVTSSTIVRANGVPVQRHSDRCTLNNGNCPGEYVHVKSTETHPAPDGKDEQDKRPWYKQAWDWTGEKASEAGKAVGQWVEDHPRTMGAVQAIGGVAEGVGSAALIVGGTAADATVVGAPLGVAGQVIGVAGLANAADNTSTGLRQMWYGKPQQTVAVQATGAAASALGATPEQAQTAQSIVSGGQVVLGGVAGAGNLAKQGGQALAKGAAAETSAAARAEAQAAERSAATEAGEQGARSTRAILKKTTYKRPSGFRKGVRNKAWEDARGPDGKVRDPLTGKEMNENEPWDMGHKPGYEFRKAQESAIDRGISRDQFLNEYNDAGHYRPELPSSNRSHAGEDMSDSYLGY